MTLRGRIALLTIAATVMTVALATVLSLTAVNRVLTRQVDDQLLRRVNVEFGRQLLDEVSRSAQVSEWNVQDQPVILVDALLQESIVPNVGITATVPFESESTPENIGEVTLTTETIDGVALRMATARLSDDVVVRAIRSIEDVRATSSRIGSTVALLGGLIALLSALVVWLTVDRSTRPVRALARSAEAAGASANLALLREETAVIAKRTDEVGELAKSLSSMSSSLEESREQQRRLVDNAAHELRTPLTSLRTNLEFLQTRDISDPSARDALMDAVNESQSLGDLINELVTLASDLPHGDAPFTTVKLDALVADVVTRTERRTDRKIDVDLGPATVQGDAYLLERAVGNLLGNAAKFSPTGPLKVTVGTNFVTVEDSGPGIAVEHRERVLERFWRAPESRGLPGSGLGLAIVKDIAEKHGGAITIGVSETLGGAKVTFWLPLTN